MSTVANRVASSQPALALSAAAMVSCLGRLDQPCHAVEVDGQVGLTNQPAAFAQAQTLGIAMSVLPNDLGDPGFRAAHGVRYALMSGAMAGGIASEEMVIALSGAGILASFGAAGLTPHRLETALARLRTQLGNAPWAANLIHSPMEEALEARGIELMMKYGVRTVEASAYMALTPHIVRYRVAGLSLDRDGRVQAAHRIIAKLSRPEVAEKFLAPPPPDMLRALLMQKHFTEEQARLAAHVCMADDITVEADSGGHTDRRPLTAQFPAIADAQAAVAARFAPAAAIRLGAAGGLGTPEALLAAYALGASYVVTGTVNQACVEAGTSTAVKALLAKADIVDMDMAPAADMFELGVSLQVLKKGVFFPMRARKLYAIWQRFDSLEAIPADERAMLERDIFQNTLAAIWEQTAAYFNERDPAVIERAATDPKHRMALLFRWYLGMASRWAVDGAAGRERDYQIWCGPAIGAFNRWTRGTPLEAPENRHVVDVNRQLLAGAAYRARVAQLESFGVRLPLAVRAYRPFAARWEN